MKRTGASLRQASFISPTRREGEDFPDTTQYIFDISDRFNRIDPHPALRQGGVLT
jgi:hypothetical protein